MGRLGDKRFGNPVRDAFRRQSPSMEVSDTCPETLNAQVNISGTCSESSLSHNNDWPAPEFHCLQQFYIQDAPQVSATRSRPEKHAALECLDPWFIHVVIDMMPRFPGRLVSFRANAARAQRDDAICATCSHNPATVRTRGASITRVAAW